MYFQQATINCNMFFFVFKVKKHNWYDIRNKGKLFIASDFSLL